MDLLDRMADKFTVGDGCWIWTAAHTTGTLGYEYGQIWKDGRVQLAHRVMYELLVGPIPEGLTLDHLRDRCGNTLCIRPDHLEPVTHQVNCQRGLNRYNGLTNLRKTHCPQGHPYDEKNTYMHNDKRGCKECRRENVRRWRARNI